MKTLSFLSVCFAFAHAANAQKKAEITFSKEKDTLRRSTAAHVYQVNIRASAITIPPDSLSLYTLTVKSNSDKSTIAPSGYSLHSNVITFDKLAAGHAVFLTLKADSAIDRDRLLTLELEITKDGKKQSVNIANDSTTLDLTIESARAINKYNYLAYVGTNFDLVDGIRAQNLFFAVNLFAPPQEENQGFGFNLTMYGNRTLTTTDTSGRVTYTSRAVALGGDSARYYTEEALKTVSRVSDNLGATFNPLIRIGNVSNPGRATQLFLAPQFEFIWRRTQVTSRYTDAVPVDSFTRQDRPISGTLYLTPPSETIHFNIYDVYLGLAGLYLSHENDHISIRVQASAGLTYRYTPKSTKVTGMSSPQYIRDWNYSCFVRAWVTEPVSGLTFGAEVTNNFLKADSYQPYYNVTLSKAINLNALGAIFKPVATRN